MEHIDKKIPQNLKDAIKDIGELSCIFWLYYHFSEAGWSVYRNIDERGYDILLVNRKTTKQKRIEVKTRQRVVCSASNRNMRNTHFTLTPVEKESSNYLVAYWLEKNWFFIVPTATLKQTSSNGAPLYKFIVKVDKRGNPDSVSAQYLNKWDQIVA